MVQLPKSKNDFYQVLLSWGSWEIYQLYGTNEKGYYLCRNERTVFIPYNEVETRIKAVNW